MKDYQEYGDHDEGTWQKHLFDLSHLPLTKYLVKYHREMSDFNHHKWREWMEKVIEPAFDETRHLEMIKNFGYISLDKHDFKRQQQFYNQLTRDARLDEETRKFIGFMAGSHFFDKYVTSLVEWFQSYYWTRPDLARGHPDYKLDYTINELLDLPHGLNYFKSVLLGLNYWRR